MTYYYGMRLRGFAPGCQPKDGLIGTQDVLPRGTFAKYHDVLKYSRPLTEKELADYELDFLTKVDCKN